MTFEFNPENIKENFAIVPLTVVVYMDANCSARSAHTNTQNLLHWPAKLNAICYSTRSTFASICFIAFQDKYRFYYRVPSRVEQLILRMLPYHFPGFGERKALSRTINLSLSFSLYLRFYPPGYVPVDIEHVIGCIPVCAPFRQLMWCLV
jgi:hypothetical protein